MSGRAISKLECEKLNQTILKMWEEFKFPEKLTIDDKNRLKKFKDNAYALSMWIKNDTVFYLRNKKVEEQESELDAIVFWLKKATWCIALSKNHHRSLQFRCNQERIRNC